MKIKSMLLCLALTSTGLNAATCLSTAEQKVVNRNYQNSLESYDYIKIDCSNPKLQTVCSNPMNVKMLNTMIRMNVWNEENAFKTEFSASDLSKLQIRYAANYSQSTCQKIKKDFFKAINSNGGWDY